MADYIERQAIYKKIAEMEEAARSRYLDTPWDSPARVRYMAQLNELTALKHMIADEPAANAREDVRSEWVWDTKGLYPKPLCRKCNYEPYRASNRLEDLPNFCPNCGARMTGGGER